jgi:beta-glucosidase
LNSHDESLVKAVAAANPRTVVVLITGSAVITEAWKDKVPAILVAWYPGMEGGHAIADVLLGNANPGGRLPCVFPRSPDQLPFFESKTDSIEYGFFHGYRLMDKQGFEPAFPFGFGLSYTTFTSSNLHIDHHEIDAAGSIQARLEVTNTGSRSGDEVIQWYAGREQPGPDEAVKALKGFQRIHLEAGETRPVDFRLDARALAVYNEQATAWKVEPGHYFLYAGHSSAESQLLRRSFSVIEQL